MKNEKSHTNDTYGAFRKDETSEKYEIINSISSIPKTLDFRVNSLKLEYASKKKINKING